MNQAASIPPFVDERTIRDFFEILHEAAAKAFAGVPSPGFLNLCRFNAAAGDNGAFDAAFRFRIGDVDGMTDQAVADARAGFNVYVEGRTVKSTVRHRSRGTALDTIGVFALVIDADADKGKDGISLVAPSLVVESSPGNHHYWHFIDRAMAHPEAQQIGEAMRAAGGDTATGKPDQPYRVPGTPNYPSLNKQGRGRTICATSIIDRTALPLTKDEIMVAYPLHNRLSSVPSRSARDASEFINELSEFRRWQLSLPRNEMPNNDRSAHFFNVSGFLKGDGFTIDEVEAIWRQYPEGAAEKYLSPRDRLRKILENDWGKLTDAPADPLTITHVGGKPVDRKTSEVLNGAQAPIASSAPAKRMPVTATPYVWTAPAAIPVRSWLYGRHLLRKFVSATIAPGGVGKTSQAVVENLAMVSGLDLLGMTLQNVGQLRAWYLNLEDPRDEVTRQIQAAALHYGLTAEDIGDRLFVDSGREQEFIIADTQRNGATICNPVVDSIISELRSRQIDVLTVDPFVSSHEVEENDNGAMDLVVKQWGKIADAANCAVHLIHHTRKLSGAAEVTVESSRGGKALTDGCRSVRTINRMTSEEGEKSGIENHRLYFRTYNDKANLAPPADKSDWYRLTSVDLGNGGTGLSDQMGVVTSWKWPDAFSGITVSDLRKVQMIINQGDWKESSQARSWAGHAVAEALELDIGDPEAKSRVKSMLKQWLKSGALKVERRTGTDRHFAPYIVIGEWANDD